MLSNIVPVPAPRPASSHILNVGLPAIPTNDGPAEPWTPALPEVEDLDHYRGCARCRDAEDDRLDDVDCGECGYFGAMPVAFRGYSTVEAHCPQCGTSHREAREHDRDAA
ncbi:hypothetical protein G3H63_09390 [Microbacterium resistens]|uniref:hypothetical protein n=1 Tax=Microbacterium resistens TaxID=156977 RepID=UPI001C585A93|nr:hypothetical protein [Microbacterium resistens]MBW1639283.1 hypothetical protein [Microbacterium resistens]